MNKTIKQTIATVILILLTSGGVFAQPHHHHGPDPEMERLILCNHDFPTAPAEAVKIAATEVCYLPERGMFAMIDSIDCAVDLLMRDGNTLRRIGRFTTDVAIGRHDLKNILRPKSIAFCCNRLLVLASSQKDSSYLAVVDMQPVANTESGIDTLHAVARQGFKNNSFALQIDKVAKEIVVVGKNAVGYDINILSTAEGVDNIGSAAMFHYHVPKQAERIKQSDPVGVGLTLVAIAVVFFALVCICFIMKGYGSIIQSVQNRNAAKGKTSKILDSNDDSTEVNNEVYAAIAAAIYAYEQDLHDEEDTIITIQKVERAWTPWNAKFYNMNRYFMNRK